jgi:hypothetical protein
MKNIPSLLGSFILINHSLPLLFVGYIFFIPKISFVAGSEDDEDDGDNSLVSTAAGLGVPGSPLLSPVPLLAPADL